MKRYISVATAFLMGAAALFSQENTVNRIPTVGNDPEQTQLGEAESGFWIAAEVMGGYSAHLYGHNMGITEFDVTAGYRFNEFLRIGAGTGLRYFIDSKDIRQHSSGFGMPLFVAARGNMIRGKYRNVVPYWGFEFGGAFPDGIMFRPTVGLRFGAPRQAWTLGLSYMGQNIAVLDLGVKKKRLSNFFMLRFGYEF